MASVHHLLVIAFFISIPLSCTNVALAARHLLHNSKNVPPLPRPKLPPLPPNLTSTPTASVPTLPSPAETFGPPSLSPAPPSISVLPPPNPPQNISSYSRTTNLHVASKG
ncbi:hypothetical protein OIU78_025789 [Salix suchowensis]|nr:hypothetical protein OIU78_025789 [Salix suchowensis]